MERHYPIVAEAIEEAFGERCLDYEPECFCCRAWAEYDEACRLAEAFAAEAERNKEAGR